MTDQLADQYSDDQLLQARQDMHERFSEYRNDVRRWVSDRISYPAGSRLLDVGCGNGRYFRYFEDRRARAVGMDLFPGMLQAASRAGAARLVAASATSLPFGGESFDVVCLNHMLGFVSDRVEALDEARRVLRPGGTVAVTLNTRAHSRQLYEVWNEAVARTGREPIATAATSAYRAEDALIQVDEVFGGAKSEVLDNAFVFTDPENPIEYLATTHFAQEEDPPLSAAEVKVVEATVLAEADRIISIHGVWRVPKPVMVITATK